MKSTSPSGDLHVVFQVPDQGWSGSAGGGAAVADGVAATAVAGVVVAGAGPDVSVQPAAITRIQARAAKKRIVLFLIQIHPDGYWSHHHHNPVGLRVSAVHRVTGLHGPRAQERTEPVRHEGIIWIAGCQASFIPISPPGQVATGHSSPMLYLAGSRWRNFPCSPQGVPSGLPSRYNRGEQQRPSPRGSPAFPLRVARTRGRDAINRTIPGSSHQ